ncbi:MAG: 4-hydroxythreonine-4-phosphate dehydrogenase PdxA [Elusimicrobiota bacterium]
MSATSRPKPRLAFTCGDPAGIGPQAVVLALRSKAVRRACQPVVVGEWSVWKRAGWTEALAPLVDTGLGLKPPAFGRVSKAAGQASFAAVRLAVRLAARGQVEGVVTAPISKEAWKRAGVRFPDHTEYLRKESGREVEMVLGAPAQKLWCVPATRHIPLAKVSASLNVPRVLAAARSLSGALKLLLGRRPKLGLCAFNPHAGESGILGGEESRVLRPAALAARKHGVDLSDPIPADTAWRRHVEGKLDGLVTLYHDQALIPLKTAAGLAIVNWTVGLAFPRTSPGHGTGFDLAGRSKPDPSATIEAALLAARLV